MPQLGSRERSDASKLRTKGEGGGWAALGFGIYVALLYGAARIAFTKIRAAVRAHHLRTGTLAELVDNSFILYLEFMVIIAYGFLSTVSCLVGVDSDPTDLMAGEMWGECGPVTLVRRSLPPRRPQHKMTQNVTSAILTALRASTIQANFCLGLLFWVAYMLKLAIFETGIAEVRGSLFPNLHPGPSPTRPPAPTHTLRSMT